MFRYKRAPYHVLLLHGFSIFYNQVTELKRVGTCLTPSLPVNTNVWHHQANTKRRLWCLAKGGSIVQYSHLFTSKQSSRAILNKMQVLKINNIESTPDKKKCIGGFLPILYATFSRQFKPKRSVDVEQPGVYTNSFLDVRRSWPPCTFFS
jgi:hypothetical protein